MSLPIDLGPRPPEVRLPPEPAELTDSLAAGSDPAGLVTAQPTFLAGWAALSEGALAEGDAVAAYAYARVGYHRGLDRLRAAGWRGTGRVPWAHEPNRGFLRSLRALAAAAAALGETDEEQRCSQFLRDCLGDE